MGDTFFADIPGVVPYHYGPIAAIAKGTSLEQPVFRAPYKGHIMKAVVIPRATVLGAATHNFALEMQNKGQDGTGTTKVTAVKTFAAGTNLTAHDEFDLAASGTSKTIEAGDVISLSKTENGNGSGTPILGVYIEYRAFSG